MRNEKRFLALVEDYLARGIFPGCEFAWVKPTSSQEFVRGQRAILPEAEGLKAGLHWDLASVTKVVGTGTALINLLLAGELELDAPLQRYYPDFQNATVTLRQLLTHHSGINPFIKNRDALKRAELTAAINQIEVTKDQSFRYTDLNFILLGFMLEHYYQQDLGTIFREQIFGPWQMTDTGFRPFTPSLCAPTSLDVPIGTVHDPKAQVLGPHCGSAGLFSTLSDLTAFVRGYFADDKYLQLLQDYSPSDKPRSLAWDFWQEDWLAHTGYTGSFILLNLRAQEALIFLSNRVHLKDERAQWIIDRNKLIAAFLEK